MKVLTLTLSLFLVFNPFNYCLCYVSYKDYAVVKAFPKTFTDLSSLDEIRAKFGRHVDFWSEPNSLLSPVTFDISPSSKKSVLSYLNDEKLNFTIETHNLGQWIEKDSMYISEILATEMSLNSTDFEQYYPYERIVDILKSFQDKYPSTVKYSSIGKTYEMRDIPSVAIDSDPSQKKPAIFFECGIHAREWVSPATCLWIINDLLTTNNGKKLLDAHSYHFVVVTNPDGYVHTWTIDRLWRKNRIPGMTNLFWDCSGVDLNRNFDAAFGSVGASDNQCDYTYRGKYAFSEKETQAVRDYVRQVASSTTIDVYFAVHSFTQVWLYPFGTTYDLPQNKDEYSRLGSLAVEAIKKTHGERYRVGPIAHIMYMSSGTSIDWVESNNLSKLSFALELRDTGKYGFRLPPQFIKPTAEENWNGIKAVLQNM